MPPNGQSLALALGGAPSELVSLAHRSSLSSRSSRARTDAIDIDMDMCISFELYDDMNCLLDLEPDLWASE